MIVSVLVLINVNFTKGLHKLENKKSRNTSIVTKKNGVFFIQSIGS